LLNIPRLKLFQSSPSDSLHVGAVVFGQFVQKSFQYKVGQPSDIAISVVFAPQTQRGFPVDIVRNTNLLTYLLTFAVSVNAVKMSNLSAQSVHSPSHTFSSTTVHYLHKFSSVDLEMSRGH